MHQNKINEFLILLKMRIDKLTLCLLLTLELRAELTGLLIVNHQIITQSPSLNQITNFLCIFTEKVLKSSFWPWGTTRKVNRNWTTMSNIAHQRIQREFREVVKSEEVAKSGVELTLVKEDLTELSGTIKGPPDTPYEGGTFQVEIKIPDTYPFNPPKAQWTFLRHFLINTYYIKYFYEIIVKILT